GLAWLPASLSRLREGRVLASILAALVLVTAFAFAIAPRLLERVADRTFQDTVAAAPIDRRDLAFTQQGRIAASSSAPVGALDAARGAIQAQLPGAIQGLISGRVFVVDSARWIVTSRVAALSMLNFRIQEGADSHIRV